MNTYQQFMEKEKEQEDKKRRVRLFLITVGIGLVILTVYLIIAMRPLDEIENYEVHVMPQPDGTLEITYQYEWNVLNSTREGPLEWVKLGMPNSNYKIVEYGGAIIGRHFDLDHHSDKGSYASFTLNRSYYEGETASFWFTVTQNRLLCENTENPNQPFYDFTPGWFDQIPVKHYKFYWYDFAKPVAHNADYNQGGTLVWEGSLASGKSRNMRVSYDMDAFLDSAQLVTWTPSNRKNDKSRVNPVTVLIIFLFTGVIGVSLFVPRNSYEDGSGYGSGYYGHHHDGGGGTGGGGGCACAGCACACACAGGGRAGCSQKDFYHAVHLPRILADCHLDKYKEET